MWQRGKIVRSLWAVMLTKKLFWQGSSYRGSQEVEKISTDTGYRRVSLPWSRNSLLRLMSLWSRGTWARSEWWGYHQQGYSGALWSSRTDVKLFFLPWVHYREKMRLCKRKSRYTLLPNNIVILIFIILYVYIIYEMMNSKTCSEFLWTFPTSLIQCRWRTCFHR